MRFLFAVLVGLSLSSALFAEPLVEGWVRLASGEAASSAQVMVFDLTALPHGPVAVETTDADGHFALPLASLGVAARPQGFALGQNYPNPFNPSTIIPYQTSTASYVRLEVFNLLGQRVATLVDGARPAGFHTALWDAPDAAGQPVASGVYIYRLRGAGVELTRRLVLVDGQAGRSAVVPGTVEPAFGAPPEPADRTYGLVVSGAGLVSYVDASFAVGEGMGPVEVVVEAVGGLPRGKALTCGILGDVNNDGRVDVSDALLAVVFIHSSQFTAPNNGNIGLGDVNYDGEVDWADVGAIMTYITNSSDASLPAGIGQAATSVTWLGLEGAGRRLTSHRDGDELPAWSPDGRQIAFRSNRDGNRNIYVMAADGTNPRRLTAHVEDDGHPTWSPDGRQIAFRSNRDGNWNIYVMAANGTNPRRLTAHVEDDGHPTWSPDGRQIAFESNRDGNWNIYVMAADGTNPRQLTAHIEDDGSPTWSPDGRQIAFESNRDGNWNIYVMAADGTNPRWLTAHVEDDGSPAWSPDGRQLAFHSRRDGNWNIYVMAADGTNPRQLTDRSAPNAWPAWSPDGRQLAFHSRRNDNWDIYVMDVGDGSCSYRPVQINGGGGTGDYSDTRSGAARLSLGGSRSGRIDPAGDVDYFRVEVSSTGTLTVYTTGSTDTYGRLKDSSGYTLASNDDGGAGRNFRIERSVSARTYYIEVKGYSSSTTGSYTVHAHFQR